MLIEFSQYLNSNLKFKYNQEVFGGNYMNNKTEVEVGDIVKLKKSHPCGSFDWEVLRVGMDFRLKCIGCEHQVMIPRKKVEKSIKQVIKKGE